VLYNGESFLIPFVKKAAYRYMQFDPENYPVADYKFNASSTLGIIAREYEVTQLVQLLQTMQKDSPLYNTLIQSIIDNMNLSNREELLTAMQQAMQPKMQQQQMQQQAQQLQMQFQQSQTAALSAQAQESQARATKLAAEAQAVPQELEIDRINAVTRNLREGDAEDKEFERRMKVADTLLKEKQIEGKTNVNRPGTPTPTQPSQQPLPRNIPTPSGPRNQGGPLGNQGGGTQ
jgi:septal ring factor EnvC (AmiA/AmiB activator)